MLKLFPSCEDYYGGVTCDIAHKPVGMLSKVLNPNFFGQQNLLL
jgi:hypothetical protein